MKRLTRVTASPPSIASIGAFGKPDGVQQHLLDGDDLLAVRRELRDVVRDRAGSGRAAPSPIRIQTADATIGFVADNTQNRVSFVAAPNVSKRDDLAVVRHRDLARGRDSRRRPACGPRRAPELHPRVESPMVPSLSSSCRGGHRVPYPLEVGGVDDYRMKVGSMLLTLVDPNRGFEAAYNRWYERDHFYAGCMIGPFLFAGQPLGRDARAEGRALADATTRRSRRRPTRVRTSRSTGSSRVTTPTTSTCGRAIRCASCTRRVAASPSASTRTRCCSTTSAPTYRDGDLDAVPIELALDHGYDGLVIVWLDGRGGRDARALNDDVGADARARRCSRGRRSRS